MNLFDLSKFSLNVMSVYIRICEHIYINKSAVRKRRQANLPKKIYIAKNRIN